MFEQISPKPLTLVIIISFSVAICLMIIQYINAMFGSGMAEECADDTEEQEQIDNNHSDNVKPSPIKVEILDVISLVLPTNGLQFLRETKKIR